METMKSRVEYRHMEGYGMDFTDSVKVCDKSRFIIHCPLCEAYSTHPIPM
jgi:hypothetical protein